MSIIVLDTETSGLPAFDSNREMFNPKKYKCYDTARVIELGYVVYKKDIDNKWNVEKKESMLVCPDEYKIENEKIHGISHEEAVNSGKHIQHVFNNFKKDLDESKYIVGHNLKFDVNVLMAEAYRYENGALIKMIKSKKHLCTMMMGMKKYDLKKYPKLCELYDMLFHKKFDKEPHRALNDAEACGECFHKLREKK